LYRLPRSSVKFLRAREAANVTASVNDRLASARIQIPEASRERFPVMLELFCRAPEGINLAEGGHLTPIPIDEAAASCPPHCSMTRITSSSAPAGKKSTGCRGSPRTG